MRTCYVHSRKLLWMFAVVVALAGMDAANAGQRRSLYRCSNCGAEAYDEEGKRGFCHGVSRPPGARMADPLHNWQPVEPQSTQQQPVYFICSECGRMTFDPATLSEDCPSRAGAKGAERGHKWEEHAPAPEPGEDYDRERGAGSGRDSDRKLPPKKPFRPVAPAPAG